jgi:hypothetical protein
VPPRCTTTRSPFKALRNVSLCPLEHRSDQAAVLVILHIDHNRTT